MGLGLGLWLGLGLGLWLGLGLGVGAGGRVRVGARVRGKVRFEERTVGLEAILAREAREVCAWFG